MDFSSVEFLAFLSLSVFAFYLVPSKLRWIILLVSSLIFLTTFSLHLLIFTLVFSVINYLFGILIEVTREKKPGKVLYLFGILLNIGVLVFYKYIGFLAENIIALFEMNQVAKNIPMLNLAVPLGISFYTFQVIGYLIDVRRGSEKAERHPGKFILFILYFPKFISGPVERSRNLLQKLKGGIVWNQPMFFQGGLQIIWGFLKVIMVSDRLAPFVLYVNGHVGETSPVLLLINFIVQFLYLYFNFSGYTDIVLGISKLFGIELIPNFNRPLFATSVSEYWRRWHMSLTHWCNDYIFRRIILKRLKWGKGASVYAAFVTFLIIGIWHGANWNFVILGLLQGIAINYEYFTRRFRIKQGKKIPKWINQSLSRLFTFTFMAFSHVFFFSTDVHNALHYFEMMLGAGKHSSTLQIPVQFENSDFLALGAGILIVLISEYRDEQGKMPLRDFILNRKILMAMLVLVSVVVLLISFVSRDSGFIYQQF